MVLPSSPRYLNSIIRLLVPSYSKGLSNTSPFQPGAVQSMERVSVAKTSQGELPA